MIVTTRRRDGQIQDRYPAVKEGAYDGFPIAVLVNGRFDRPAGPEVLDVEFVIEPGQTMDEITENLVTQDIVTDVPAFLYLVVEQRADELVTAGRYAMNTAMTPRQVVSRLTAIADSPVQVVIESVE